MALAWVAMTERPMAYHGIERLARKKSSSPLLPRPVRYPM